LLKPLVRHVLSFYGEEAMNNDSKATLEAIERLLVADRVGVRRALETVYQLGRLDGQMEVARLTEKSLAELLTKTVVL
jgi:hypothetical protein